jgi:hypothetical protein
MLKKILDRKNRGYIILAFLIVLITVGNYFLNGGSKSNWVEASDYGFTLLHPPGVNVWSTGLDENNVFDIYGNYRASSESGMMGFNLENKEFAVEWVTMDETPSLEEILDIHYHSGEVNAIKRDRGFKITYDPITYDTINGHEAAYQIHTLELDMPDMDEPLYAKGVVAGWTCDETGVSFVSYLLSWRSGQPPSASDSQLYSYLNKYLDTLECH